MTDVLNIDWSRVGKKWVAYFDLLGFGDFVSNHPPESVFALYETCIEVFKHQEKHVPELEYVHFSDTFLIYARNDSAGSFAAIDMVSRWFVNHLIHRQIPLRGALACDDFYADKSRSIFLGKALVEASKLGERYNWIGFVLCPSAVERMGAINLPVDERLNFMRWEAPLKVATQVEHRKERAVAYLIGASSTVNGQNIYAQVLEEIAGRLEKAEIKAKYTNTLQFLNHFGVSQPVTKMDERAHLAERMP